MRLPCSILHPGLSTSVTTTNAQSTAPILIVDDSQEIREDIAFMLHMEGMTTLQAEDGIQALDAVQETRPGLVICDLMMPEMDGFAFLDSLRSDPSYSGIPVLVISAMDNRQTMRQVMQLGADDFLGKPFSQEELIDAVKLRVGRRGRVSPDVVNEPTTGLLSKEVFIRQLDGLGATPDGVSQVAVVVINLTYFSRITTLFGASASEGVIKTIGERLLELPDDGMRCGYFGVGTFALFLPVDEDDRALTAGLSESLSFLSEPVIVADRDRRISTTWSGVRFTPAQIAEHGATNIVAQAELTQGAGREYTIVELERAMISRASTKMGLPQALRRSVEDQPESFSVAWQPQIASRSGECFGAEVLLRWDAPQLGSVPPSEFIRVAESWGLISQLAAIGLRKAIADLGGPLAGHSELHVGLNVSPIQLAQPDFASWLLEILDESGIACSRITLEITETLAMECVEDPAAKLRPLRAAGIQVALDDFGTGFSSLALLQDLRVDELKIDRAFVSDMVADTRSRDLCQNIINIAHDLGARVVAEGVETAEQHALLSDLGCDLLQGYLFSRPVSATEFAAWLQTRA